MDNDKNSTRARNRTVMLTPDLAGQVRSQLTPIGMQPEGDVEESEPAVDKGFEPPEVTETITAKTTEQRRSIPQDDNGGWDTPKTIQIIPEEPLSHDWPNGDAVENKEEVGPIKKAVKGKHQEEQVGYRNSSRSELEEIVWQTLTPLAGFLVSFDKNQLGDYVELRTGRLIVTSEREGSGNYLFIDDPSVSPMHAIMRVSVDGPTQILDQLSDNGTKIIRAATKDEEEKEEMLSGEKSVLHHGDKIVFGDRKYEVCLLKGSSKGGK